MVAPRVLRNRLVEPALTVGTAIAAEPVNILSGLLQLDDSGVVQGNRLLELFGLEPYEGEATPSQGLRRMEEVGERLTYSPRTPEGQAGLQSLKDAMVNVMDTLGVDEAINYFNTKVVPNLNRAFGEEATKEIGSAILMSAPFVKKVPGIKAYHGSPHDFDEFSMEQIGTGEGAQAYGHGLYFADSEDVAKKYRDRLTADINVSSATKMLPDKYKGSNDNARQMLTEIDQALENKNIKSPSEFIDVFDVGEDLKPAYKEVARLMENKGRMYQVDIDASPDELLDYDIPLKEQPTAEQAFKSIAFDEVQRLNDPLLNDLFESPADMTYDNLGPLFETSKGSQAYKTFAETNAAKGRENLSKKLKEKGIKGIRYKDGFSRGKDGGSYNYVIFDDRLISISKKYGIAIPAAAVLLSQETGDNPESFYQEDNSV